MDDVIDYKKNTQTQWNANPCGNDTSDKTPFTKEYFDEVERYRYETHPFLLDAIGSFDVAGKKVLEVGFGMGTDHVSLARRGAQMHGIDLTQRHYEITSKRLGLYNLTSKLTLGDGECLPYADGSFDLIYSFGVLHHTPQGDAMAREMHRVLKPGGRAWIGVYNKHSLFYWWSTFTVRYLLMCGFLHESLRAHISRIEYPGDNPNIFTHLYTQKEIAALFAQAGFSRSTTHIDKLQPEDIYFFSRFLKPRFTNRFARRLGWYIILDAYK